MKIQTNTKSNIFFLSDLHDGHANAIKYDERPFTDVDEMHAVLVANWNRVVGKNDFGFILGDLAFKPEWANRILRELNGSKYLIIGNHDNFIGKADFDAGILAGIADIATLSIDGFHIVLCHYPMEIWDRCHYGSIHLHGHIHKDDKNALLRTIPNRYNVAAPLHGYTPISLRQLMTRYGYDAEARGPLQIEHER